MLGIGSALHVQTSTGLIYRELSELANYADLDVHFDFSRLPETVPVNTHGEPLDPSTTVITNLATGGTPANHNITSVTNEPSIDHTSMIRASVTFDSADEILHMANDYETSGKAFTFFIVIQRTSVDNDYAITSQEAASNAPHDFIRLTNSGGAIQLGLNDETSVTCTTSSTAGSTTSYTVVANVPTVYVIRRQASGNVFIYADKGIHIATKSNAAIQAGANFRFGNLGGTAEGSIADFEGTIGEVGIYDTTLTADNCIELGTQLSRKWGVDKSS
tara:strand:- start:8703 stop:9527 length:825 start_codon:yes stop_codon:yes gene_type:complete